MKSVLKTWKWSLGVVARSPLAISVLVLILIAGLYADYRWLYFPMESAIYLFVLGFLWALLSLVVLVSLIAISVAAAMDVAVTDARSITLRGLLRFNCCQFLRVAGFILLAIPIAAGVYSLFEWVNSYSLEVASWLTFNTEKPVAQETADAALLWIERGLWVVISGFLISFLVSLVRDGWRASLSSVLRLLANACWRATFLTTLVAFLVFGGAAHLLVKWNPTVTPGHLDFAQVIARSGLAVVLAVAGWIFWILSISRHHRPDDTNPAPMPQAKESI
jgi:hypothetical protein